MRVLIFSDAVSSQEIIIVHRSGAMLCYFVTVSSQLSRDSDLSSMCRSWHICSAFVCRMRLYEEAEEEAANTATQCGCHLQEVT